MEKRSFSKEEKLAIIKEASINGVTSTLENHGIYPASFYSWKKKFESIGGQKVFLGGFKWFLPINNWDYVIKRVLVCS